MSSSDLLSRATSPVVESVPCAAGAGNNNVRDDTMLCQINSESEPALMVADIPFTQYVDIPIHHLCHRPYKMPKRTVVCFRHTAVGSNKRSEPISREAGSIINSTEPTTVPDQTIDVMAIKGSQSSDP